MPVAVQSGFPRLREAFIKGLGWRSASGVQPLPRWMGKLADLALPTLDDPTLGMFNPLGISLLLGTSIGKKQAANLMKYSRKGVPKDIDLAWISPFRKRSIAVDSSHSDAAMDALGIGDDELAVRKLSDAGWIEKSIRRLNDAAVFRAKTFTQRALHDIEEELNNTAGLEKLNVQLEQFHPPKLFTVDLADFYEHGLKKAMRPEEYRVKFE